MRQPFTFWLSNGFMRWVFRLLGRVEVVGRANIPSKGPYILVSNHVHALDPPLLNAVMPHRVLFLAKQELLTETRGWQHRCLLWYGMIPLDRRRLSRSTFQAATDYLSRGGVVGVFPEGTRSRAGVLQPAQPGVAYLALMAGVPVLPVAVTGIAGMKLTLRNIVRRPRVRVRIGEPFQLSVSEKVGRDSLDAASLRIMESIAVLLPEEQRGPFRRTNENASPEEAAGSGG